MCDMKKRHICRMVLLPGQCFPGISEHLLLPLSLKISVQQTRKRSIRQIQRHRTRIGLRIAAVFLRVKAEKPQLPVLQNISLLQISYRNPLPCRDLLQLPVIPGFCFRQNRRKAKQRRSP